MSKNIVDSILDIGSERIGITVTRRQVDINGGYVNNWNTKSFFDYVRNKNDYGKRIIIERDHGGPNQGTTNDNGNTSYINDLKYFQIIHIDPWKVSKSIEDGINKTTSHIKLLHSINPNVKFEIGTEQDIFKYSTDDLESLMSGLKLGLTESEYDSIEYLVIQSGESLDLKNFNNRGIFNIEHLKESVSIGKKYNKKIKEHNGDFLSPYDYVNRFNHGVNAINIGPELAVIETNAYLEYMLESEIDEFYNVCLHSMKWKRWADGYVNDFDKNHLIQICGHYNYSKYNLPNIDLIVKKKITEKLTNLLNGE